MCLSKNEKNQKLEMTVVCQKYLETPLLLPMNYERRDQTGGGGGGGELQLKMEEVEEVEGAAEGAAGAAEGAAAKDVCKFDIRCWVIIERHRNVVSTTTTTNETKETTSSTTTATITSTTITSTTSTTPVWQAKVFRRPYLRLCGTAYKPTATRSKEDVRSLPITSPVLLYSHLCNDALFSSFFFFF